MFGMIFLQTKAESMSQLESGFLDDFLFKDQVA